MQLIDRNALLEAVEKEREYLLARKMYGAEDVLVKHLLRLVDNAPTVDAVPITDVDELKMRLIGAEAAVNGMREQINRMVIINSEKVSVVRCWQCSHSEVCKMDDGDVRYCHIYEMQTEDDYYCADGERKDDA